MRKLILVNGAITLGGLLLDIYGVYDLPLFPTVLGIVGCITFVLMREEIRETFTRLKSRQVVFQNWFEEMENREPEVVATISGRSVLNKAFFLAKTLGYEVVKVSETRGKLFTKYTLTFRKKMMEE